MAPVGTALVIPDTVSVSLTELWNAATRMLGAARPLIALVTRRPLNRFVERRYEDVCQILQSESVGELNALVLRSQRRWRREAMVFAGVGMLAKFARRQPANHEVEFAKLEDALFRLLDELDAKVTPEKSVAAEMFRVAALSSLRSARTLVEHAVRGGWPGASQPSFAQFSDMVQTPLMYAAAVVFAVTTDEFDAEISIEMLNEIARRMLEASDAFAGIVGLMRDDE